MSGGATFGELLEQGGCGGGGGGVEGVFGVGVALRSFVHISATHFSQGRADYQIKKLLKLDMYKMKGKLGSPIANQRFLHRTLITETKKVTLVASNGLRASPNSICSPSTTHLSLGQFVVGKKQSLEIYPLQDLQNFSGLGENTRLKGSHALKGRRESRCSVEHSLHYWTITRT